MSYGCIHSGLNSDCGKWTISFSQVSSTLYSADPTEHVGRYCLAQFPQNTRPDFVSTVRNTAFDQLEDAVNCSIKKI